MRPRRRRSRRRRHKKMMTNMGLPRPRPDRSLPNPSMKRGRRIDFQRYKPATGRRFQWVLKTEDVDNKARLLARATGVPPNRRGSMPANHHPSILPSLSFQALQTRRRGRFPRPSRSLSEEECKNSLGALSGLSRTPPPIAALALPPSSLPAGLVRLDRVELTSDAPRLLLCCCLGRRRGCGQVPSSRPTYRSATGPEGGEADDGRRVTAVSRGIRDER